MSYRQGDSASGQSRPQASLDDAMTRDLDSVQSRRILAELQQKLESMPLIEQAKGILMARFALDAERAFHLLVRWSQVNNVKLRTISDSLVGATGDATALERTIEALQQRAAQQEAVGRTRSSAERGADGRGRTPTQGGGQP